MNFVTCSLVRVRARPPEMAVFPTPVFAPKTMKVGDERSATGGGAYSALEENHARYRDELPE